MGHHPEAEGRAQGVGNAEQIDKHREGPRRSHGGALDACRAAVRAGVQPSSGWLWWPKERVWTFR